MTSYLTKPGRFGGGGGGAAIFEMKSNGKGKAAPDFPLRFRLIFLLIYWKNFMETPTDGKIHREPRTYYSATVLHARVQRQTMQVRRDGKSPATVTAAAADPHAEYKLIKARRHAFDLVSTVGKQLGL